MSSIFGEMPCSQISVPVLIVLAIFAINIYQIFFRNTYDDKDAQIKDLLSHIVFWTIVVTLLAVLSGKCYTITAWAVLLVPFVAVFIVLLGVWNLLKSWTQ